MKFSVLVKVTKIFLMLWHFQHVCIFVLKWEIARLVDEREREKRQGEAYVKKTNIN